MTDEEQQHTTNKSAQEYIRVDRENYSRWVDFMVNHVRTINPDFPADNEPALRHLFETILDRGYRTLNGPIKVYGFGSRELPYNERLTLESFSRMSVEELEQTTNDIPDRLNESNRKLFNEIAEQRSPADRWDALFPEGANEVRMPLAGGGDGHSIDDRIAAIIARHNDMVTENIAQGMAKAEAIADPTERERAVSRVGRDISQRQIRRAPPIPNKKDPSKMEPPKLEVLNPKTNQWELDQKLGSFLEQNHEWALLDDFTVENGLKATGHHSDQGVTPLDIITNNLPDTDGIDPSRLRIVVSRDPQLIGEMSSGQCWRSCMSEDGINFHYVQKDIQQGTLVAYVVGAEDTAARYPMMRVLLKPFTSQDGHTILVPSKIYGAAAKSSRTESSLVDALTEFSRMQNNGRSGEFSMRNGLYSDGQATTVVLGAEWTPVSTRHALDSFQRGALQEYTTEWQGRLNKIKHHNGTPEELESLQREAKTIRNRITRLGEPAELARNFFR